MDKANVVHIYNGILLIKKNEVIPYAATWMAQEIILLSGVSQKEKDEHHITYLCNLKYDACQFQTPMGLTCIHLKWITNKNRAFCSVLCNNLNGKRICKRLDHGIQSCHFMANRWGNNGNSDRLNFLGLQIHCR